MKRYSDVFGRPNGVIIGMIHVPPTPSSPKYVHSEMYGLRNMVDVCVREASVYAKAGVDSVMIENMHDVPYTNRLVGPDVVAAMTIAGYEVKKACGDKPVGVQVLAGANKAALAVSRAAGLQYIRAEGFVFSHVADEGLMNSDAGELLRYRKSIDAENVLVLTDIKKKHSAHTITQDVDIAETAHAAEFFLSDGVIVTGVSTGSAANPRELNDVMAKTLLPVLVGSGVTRANLATYIHAHGLIVGSYFKSSGHWEDPVDANVVADFMTHAKALRSHTNAKL